ncbi:galactosyl transferase GMA12/MNN10 family protein [Colletotrichum abscissum]|uniref:Galactosyl transferase GMA12/MNN10 family protein n=1 Tax=Colletotrichum abscissum TaxID=1671311 RepID=A0A9P9XJT1_9PEZI|nr:galactosyl transferase GMA12/MNN10 family protein [Colletotrichum abscissum]KAI3555310.1 galactosyl transferase GMA12/MNN10 family protein [Colletotrichum abscissum]KAK1490602.1 galactosyl transferase GMA12/MNN10 family protein [Colletotrichum abscissum]
MHFAYPPRKSSNPPPFKARSSRIPPVLRRSRLKVIAAGALVFFGLIYLLSGAFKSPSGPRPPSGDPPAVIVTVLDEDNFSNKYLASIRDNRKQYAQLHGYEVMFVKAGDYDLNGSPSSWNKVVSLRHAMTKFPEARWFWYLDQDAYIMDPETSLENLVLKSDRLDTLMARDHPVVPPDSIIKTFPHLKGDDIDFVVTQDREGLSSSSFFIRNGDWAKFFIDTWFDPLYRSYNFQKAEGHALEHIVQWHPTILSKLAIVPQKTFNSYNRYDKGEIYKDGHFVVRAAGCTNTGERACDEELSSFKTKWQAAFKAQ